MKVITFGNELYSERGSIGAGEGLPTLLIAGIGITTEPESYDVEERKALSAVDSGVHMIADHSFGLHLASLHKRLIQQLGLRISVVGSYELNSRFKREKWPFLTRDDVLSLLSEQISRGVDIITLHASLTRKSLALAKNSNRLIVSTSKGGGIIADYMYETGDENPYWKYYDSILSLFSGTGVAISLGSTFRTATVCDSWDNLSEDEFGRMGELVKKADRAGVPIMVEGLGHVSIGRIPSYVSKIKRLCYDAPLRILTVPTDRALGQDDISSAIATAVAIASGADVVQVVTRKEHIGLPDIKDIGRAIEMTKVATASGELSKIGDYTLERKMAESRLRQGCKGDIRMAINTNLAREAYEESVTGDEYFCTMCGIQCGLLYGKRLRSIYCEDRR